MSNSRRCLTCYTFAAASLVSPFALRTADAQDYPVKAIRIYAGFSAGTATDVTARLVAQKLSEALGQPVIVDNRVGAAGAIATELVVRSPSDGYTLLLLGSTDTIIPALRKLPYDLQRDVAPISLVANGPQVLVVHTSVPARNVKELVALARAQPDKLRYGSAGVGSSSHLSGILFTLLGNVKIVQVAYKGATEMAVGTAANEIEMSFPSVPAALPLMDSNKVRGLAVTSAKRISVLPSMPTLDESGLRGYDRSLWYGMVAPAGVPKNIITRLHDLIEKAAATPDMRDALVKQGLEPETNSPDDFAARIRTDLLENAKLIKAADVKVD